MAFPPGGHGATCVVRTMVRGRHVIHLDHVVGMYDMSTKYHDSASSSSEATARVGPSEISSEAGPRAPKGPAMAFPPGGHIYDKYRLLGPEAIYMIDI